MYYVLFNYTEGKFKRDFQGFKSEPDLISFLHEHYKEIEVCRILEVAREYRLGLVVTEELIKSVLEPEDEEKPADYLGSEKKHSHPLLKDRKEEPRAMEKIGKDIEAEMEEDLTPKERTQKSLDDADRIIKRELKKRQERKEKGWGLCSKCNSNRIAPHNKTGICTPCQQSSEGKRPYKRKAKEEEIPF